jgi:hypothetical protein
MSHFVNLKYAAQQHGAGYAAPAAAPARQSAAQRHGAGYASSASEHAQQSAADSSSQRGLTLIVLSAMAAVMAAVAYEVIDSLAEGHLLLMWMGLWAGLLMVMSLFTGMAHRIAAALKKPLDNWSQRLAQSRSDRRLWAIAQQDHRVMADLQYAMTQNQDQATRAHRAMKAGR